MQSFSKDGAINVFLIMTNRGSSLMLVPIALVSWLKETTVFNRVVTCMNHGTSITEHWYH